MIYRRNIIYRSTVLWIGIPILILSCQPAEQSGISDGQAMSSENSRQKLDTLVGYSVEPTFGRAVNSEMPANLLTGHTFFEFPQVDTTISTQPVREKLTTPVEIVSTDRHLIKLNEPLIYTAKSTEILINDTFKDSIVITKGFKEMKFDFPKPIDAGDPRYKDLATSNMRYLDTEQGLLANFVFSVFEDKAGIIWMGIDGGLSKYDGNHFWHFEDYIHPYFKRVMGIEQDCDGNIWICTRVALIKFDGIKFSSISVDEGLDAQLQCIFIDSKNTIWLGSEGKGLIRVSDDKLEFYGRNNGLICNDVWDIYENKNGQLFVGSTLGLSVIDNNRITRYRHNENHGIQRINGISESSDGLMWLSSFGGGFTKFNGFHCENYDLKQGLPENFLTDIYVDGNVVWIGTYGNGLYKFVDNQIEHFTRNRGLSHMFISRIYEDSNENLWLSTSGGGITIMQNKSFNHLTREDGLTAEQVMCIEEDVDGNLWFGCTYGGGMSMYDGKNFHRFQNRYLKGITANCMLPNQNKSIWIGTFGNGLYLLEKEDLLIYLLDQNHANQTIRNIMCDKNGTKWICTDGGLILFDGTSFLRFSDESGLNDAAAWFTFEANDGSVWIATESRGVVRYQNGKLIRYSEKEGLFNNIVNTVHQDKFGKMWLGTTSAGLICFDGEGFTQYGIKEGLSYGIVWSISEDRYGNLWVGTEIGMNYINQHMEKSVPTIYSYKKADGMKGLTCFANSSLIDTRNRLWFGTEQCLTMLDLNEFHIPDQAPEVRISEVAIKGDFIDYRKNMNAGGGFAYDSVEQFTNIPIGLELPYSQNHLTISFSGVDWDAMHKVKYSFRMIGFDSTWTKLADENKADYRNLPYGDFVFEVRAFGQGNVWSAPVAFNFTILPPWWHTWWARLIYLIAGFTVVRFIVRLRTLRLRLRQRSLEIQVWSATKNIVAQKAEIERQHHELEETHQEIHDSILYAKRIQDAILPGEELIKNSLGESFVVYIPKDVVAGDFYWVENKDGLGFFAAADCTGHGVPGAMVSVMCNSALNRSVREFGLRMPSKILDNVRDLVIREFEYSSQDVKDGMDISLVAINRNERKIQWAGANNPLWIIKNNSEFIEIKADKQPVGKFERMQPFTNHSLSVEEGDVIYLFSDGFPDQFGGENLPAGKAGGKKYKYKNFRDFLKSIHKQPMNSQQKLLEAEFARWRAGFEQVDDICIIGVRIS